MLRTQTKKQPGFYVCSLCRRSYQQHTTQPHAARRTSSHSYPPSSRPVSSSPIHTSERPSCEVLPRAQQGGKRTHSTWGKFGSNTVPGQSNAAWAAGIKRNQGILDKPAGSVPGGGGAHACGKILPAKGTSSWLSQSGSGSSLPSPPASNLTARSTLPTTSTQVPASTAWQPSASPLLPQGRQNAHPNAYPGSASLLSPQVAHSSQPNNPQASIDNSNGGKLLAASSHNVQSSSQPTSPGSSSGAGPLNNSLFGSPFTPFFGKPVNGSGIAPIKPVGAPSAIPSTSSTGSPPGLSLDDLRQFAVSRDAQALKVTPRIQPQTFKAQTVKTAQSVTKTLMPPPPPPPPAGYPQLRKKVPKNDLFEAMSPFSMPRQSAPPPRTSATPRPAQHTGASTAQSSADSFKLMEESVVTDSKKIKTALQDDWGFLNQIPSKNQFHINRNTAPVPQRSGGQPIPDKTSDDRFVERQSPPSSYSFTQDARTFDAKTQTSPTDNERGVKKTSDAASQDLHQERHADERRRRGRDSDRNRDWEMEQDYDDRRKKPGKSKKSKNRRQQEHDDDYDGDYDYDQAMALREERARAKEEKRAAKEALVQKKILLPEYISVSDLANALRIKPRMFLVDLEQLGFENIVQDSVMTGETAALVAAEYGFETKVDTGDGRDLKPRPPPEDPFALPPRPPIVTIMGHVDHGKTTMLDWLRKSSVAAGEHGGITQHIGAFSVKLKSGKLITFLDTPGHAAFLSMRQRGANVTDIVVLVVAVDDSVKPQTIEAIKHAQNAKVPMIVAINKIDVDDDPRRIDAVKTDLASNGVEIEDYGGDVQVVAVSGVTGRGMGDLEESILTLSEILDMRAETDGMAEGWVLEASVKADGRAATILVKRGTLRIGDLIVAGKTYTRIRTMKNEAGTDMKEAGPGTPVEIYGSWKQPPMAGDMVLQAPDETKAQNAVEYRQEIADRANSAAQQAQKELADREEAERKALEEEMEELADGDEGVEAAAIPTGPIIYNVIVKGDVMGSVEALTDAIKEIGSNEIQTRILRASSGLITESDIDHMAMAQGCIVNFNTVIPSGILRRADDAGVKILDYNIIYEVVDALKLQMSELLEPTIRQKVSAEAEVLQVFPINIIKRKFKNIAGVRVRLGTVTRGGQYRVIRDGESIFDGKLEALKQNKKDVNEMKNGTECGMMFEDFDDFMPGDIIQLYENIEERRYL